MKTILILCLEMLVCGAVFHLLYRTAFEGRVRFVGCRIYLIVAAALSAIIPALDIRVWRDQIVYIEATALNSTTTADIAVQNTFNLWTAIIIGVYSIGLAIVVASAIRQVVKIARLGAATVENCRRIVHSSLIDTPFSFLHTIYLPTSLTNEHCEVVIQHECAHIRHHHSLERIAMEVMKAVQWFNPFVWLFSRLLTEVHEFEADREVIDSGFDNRLYATSIFTQAFGFSPDIANGLQSSLTKKRFKMMTKQTPSKRSMLRLAVALPVVATLVMLFSVRAQATVYLPAEDQTPTWLIPHKDGDIAFTIILTEYIADPNHTPIMIVDDHEVTMEEFKAIDLSREALLAQLRLLDYNKAVALFGERAKYGVFTVSTTANTTNDNSDAESSMLAEKETPFILAEQMPTFDGNKDLNGFRDWCSKQIDHSKGTAGMQVIMQFVVETDGSVKEIKALKGNLQSCAEVERIIRLSSGRWTAGVQRGEKVRVAYTIPIVFSKK